MIQFRRTLWMVAVGLAGLLWNSPLQAQRFLFPTDNRALLEPNGQAEFYVGTVGRSWESGSFGCVRSDGHQFHEGLDIRSQKRDASGEPADAVYATAKGTVAYINDRTALSNFGKYIILEHRIEGIPVFSTYAHLSRVKPGLKAGTVVQAGEKIGTMGRTTNTREKISRERAHLHFEINLKLNDRFDEWLMALHPGGTNDHGNWNGRNFIGLDAEAIFLAQHRLGSSFSLLEFLRDQEEMFRVFVPATPFPWLRHYALLIRHNPTAVREGVVALEISINYYGLPFLLVPRAPSEVEDDAEIRLLAVNEEEYHRHPCRRLIAPDGNGWRLTERGRNWLDLLLFSRFLDL